VDGKEKPGKAGLNKEWVALKGDSQRGQTGKFGGWPVGEPN